MSSINTISQRSSAKSESITLGSTEGAVAGLSKSVNDLGRISGTNGSNAAALSITNPQFGSRENNGSASAGAIFKNFLG